MTAPTLTVRLLGRLEVVRADGTQVTASELRTTKTMDLLRLLALADGRTVPVVTLTDRLWPDAAPQRARASLRTAASQIRHAGRTGAVVRRIDGLALVDAWVDVHHFRDRARQAAAANEADDWGAVVAAAAEAEALYVGDLHACDDDSAWARHERTLLQHERRELSCLAAEAALRLGQARRAVAFAEVVVEVEPLSERAHRVLMRAYAEMGELAMAMRVFERHRSLLAAELGIDPSPQTRALHLALLRHSELSP
jgi:SARP family transcriptional regulator, regulator of embCAB operon